MIALSCGSLSTDWIYEYWNVNSTLYSSQLAPFPASLARPGLGWTDLRSKIFNNQKTLNSCVLRKWTIQRLYYWAHVQSRMDMTTYKLATKDLIKKQHLNIISILSPPFCLAGVYCLNLCWVITIKVWIQSSHAFSLFYVTSLCFQAKL